MTRIFTLFLFLLSGTTISFLNAQDLSYDEALYNALEWRNIGPFRGGRSATVTGVEGKPNLYYMGSTGGGVWRTHDGGQTWENISDGFFGRPPGKATGRSGRRVQV